MTRRLLLTVLTVLAAGFARPGSAAAPPDRSLDDYPLTPVGGHQDPWKSDAYWSTPSVGG